MNPQGRFKATLYNEAIRYGDRDYEEAIKRGELDHLLLDVGVQEEHCTENLLFDTWLTFLFYRSGWSGCPTPPTQYNESTGNGPGMWGVYLTTYAGSGEPSYTDGGVPGTRYTQTGAFSYNTGATGFKKFVADAIEQATWIDPTGREQIFHRQRWFYYPQDVTSNNNNINGIWIVWNSNVGEVDGYDSYKEWMGRVRFKDNNGDFVRIHKTNYQAMGLEYTFSFLTV